MADYFALLSERRRPWLDTDQLKQKFLALSAELHPDRVHGNAADDKQRAQERYTELNSAYQCLLQPRDRLAHLIEIESSQKPPAIQTAPPALMDLFLEIGELCREVDKFLADKRATESPLLQVRMFAPGQVLTDRINSLQQRLRAIALEGEAALQKQNIAWEKAPPIGDPSRLAALPLTELEEHYRTFSYISRWSAQLQERLVQLAL